MSEFFLLLQPGPPVNTSLPTITGQPIVGSLLVATTGSWSGAPTSYAYQWQRNPGGTWTNIAGATSASRTLVAADVGLNLRVVVTATNGSGSTPATSAATAAIAAAPVGVPNKIPLYLLQVLIAWEPSTSGYWVLDSSQLDLDTVLAPAVFSVGFNGPYDDVTSYIKGAKTNGGKVSIRRGRDQNLGEMQGGEGTIVGRDPTGFFNPANPNSPIVEWVNKSYRPVLVRTVYGATYGQFRGFTDRITFTGTAPRGGMVQIELIDLFKRLRRVRPVIEDPGPTTTGAAIGLVLDYIGWTDPAMRSIDTGESIPGFIGDGETDGLKLIQDLTEAAAGVSYIDGDGVFVFRNVDYRNNPNVSTGISGGMRAVSPGVDPDAQQSRVTVIRTDFEGTELGRATASDAIAEQEFGISDYPEIRTPYLLTDAAAQTLADRILFLVKTPRPPIWDLKLSGRTPALLQQILGGKLTDVVSVAEQQTGTEGLYLLERVTLDLEPGKAAEASWALSSKPVQGNIFTLDQSVLDGTDVLGF